MANKAASSGLWDVISIEPKQFFEVRSAARVRVRHVCPAAALAQKQPYNVRSIRHIRHLMDVSTHHRRFPTALCALP